MERTYVMLKPDALERGLVGNILTRIENKGYKIIDIKKFTLTKEILDDHYSHKMAKPFYPEIVSFMTRGDVIGIIVEGNGAIEGIRLLAGPTYYTEAHPGTIRGDFANSLGENLIHASDSKENAAIEIARFFG
ncbi:MAG: nucleoside-diphosphate kinase [Candidatus Izemoplasma sp.]